MEDMLLIADDRVPSLHIATGTEIFAEAMGCPVHYPLDTNPFALPCVESAAVAAKLKTPRWEDTRLAILFKMADELHQRAGSGVVFRMPDIQSIRPPFLLLLRLQYLTETSLLNVSVCQSAVSKQL